MNSSTDLYSSASEPAAAESTSLSDSAAACEFLRCRGWAFLQVSGKSMFPWIRPSDVIFLRRVAITHLRPGDVVVFESRGALCVHRVLRVHEQAGDQRGIALTTKGDAVADEDSCIHEDALLGKVEYVYRRNRELPIASGWRKHLGRILAVLSPRSRALQPAAVKLSHAVSLTARVVSISHRFSEHSAD